MSFSVSNTNGFFMPQTTPCSQGESPSEDREVANSSSTATEEKENSSEYLSKLIPGTPSHQVESQQKSSIPTLVTLDQQASASMDGESKAEESKPLGTKLRSKITVRKTSSPFSDPLTSFLVSRNTSNAPNDQIAVSMRVTDLQRWKAYCESTDNCKHHTEIRLRSNGPNELWLVTARVPKAEAGTISGFDYVKSLKASQPLYPQ